MYPLFGFSYMHFQVRLSFIQLRRKFELFSLGSVSVKNVKDPIEYPGSKRIVDLCTTQLRSFHISLWW